MSLQTIVKIFDQILSLERLVKQRQWRNKAEKAINFPWENEDDRQMDSGRNKASRGVESEGSESARDKQRRED
jgi:hypothetical protein